MIFLTFLLLFHLIGPYFVYKKSKSNKTVKQKEIVFIILSFIILFTFSAFRAIEIGNDTVNYYNFYDKLKLFNFTNTHFDKGYVLFNHILKMFFKHPQYLLIFTSLIIILGIYLFFYKKSNMMWFSLLIFLLSHTYFTSFNTLRQNIAFVILIFSYNAYQDKKYIIFILITLLAATFHLSSIIFLGLLFTPLFKNRKRSIYAVLILSVVIIVFPLSILSKLPYFDHYLSSAFDNANRPAAILNSFIALSIITLGYFYRGDREEITLLEKMTLISLLISVSSIRTSVATRVNVYFFPFLIVYLTNTVFLIKNKKEQIFVMATVILMFTFNYYIIAIYRPEWNYIYPYRFFFQKS